MGMTDGAWVHGTPRSGHGQVMGTADGSWVGGTPRSGDGQRAWGWLMELALMGHPGQEMARSWGQLRGPKLGPTPPLPAPPAAARAGSGSGAGSRPSS